MPAAVALNGRVLLQESVEELRRWLGQLDPATEDDDAGFASPSLGLGFYVPDSEGDRVEAVIAHEPGYYDRDR